MAASNSKIPAKYSSPITEIAAQSEELRSLLVRLCEINSGSHNTPGVAQMLGALRELFGEIASSSKATVEVVPAGVGNPGALRVRCRPEAKTQILLNGHYDTVFGADDPFQKCTQLDAEVLRGPGVIDMKGGIVILYATLRAFEKTEAAKNIGWEILLTPDEEIGSAGSKALLEDAAKRFQFGLIFETAFGPDIVRSRKGVGTFKITVHGRAAHAGRDITQGRNAIVALAQAIDGMDALNRELSGVIVNVGSVTGGGTVNIVPALASCEVNIRITRAADAARVESALRHIVGRITEKEGYRAEISGGFSAMPMESGPLSEKLFAGYRECAAALGIEVDWKHSGGGSDGNKLSACGLPVLDGLGAVGSGLHSDAEQVWLPSLVNRAQTAALFLMRLGEGEITLL